MRRSVLAVAVCCLVLFAGCQGLSQPLGGAGAEQTTATPTPTPTPTSTPSPTPSTPSTPSTSTAVPTESDGSFDAVRFRQQFVEAVDRARETRGFQPLSVDSDRRRVADSTARDLAAASYFGNATAQNDSRFSVSTRLRQRGLNCTSASAGGAFFLKGHYRTYTNTSTGVAYYSTEDELAQSMTTRLLNGQVGPSGQLAETVFSPEATTQSVGVYRTPDDVVYVVYVVCAV